MLKDHYNKKGTGWGSKVSDLYFKEGELMDVFPFPVEFANIKAKTFKSDLKKMSEQYQ